MAATLLTLRDVIVRYGDTARCRLLLSSYNPAKFWRSSGPTAVASPLCCALWACFNARATAR